MRVWDKTYFILASLGGEFPMSYYNIDCTSESQYFIQCIECLRMLASYEAKTAKISNFGIFWSITPLIYHLFIAEL